MTVMNGRSVVITEPDFDRLKALLHERQIRLAHGPTASRLEAELDGCEVVHPSTVPDGIVTMRSKVRVRDPQSGQRARYTLVYPEEADIDEGKVSVLAPIGRAILGAREGEVVEFAAPGGIRRLRVERILYQPEAAGDYHL